MARRWASARASCSARAPEANISGASIRSAWTHQPPGTGTTEILQSATVGFGDRSSNTGIDASLAGGGQGRDPGGLRRAVQPRQRIKDVAQGHGEVRAQGLA